MIGLANRTALTLEPAAPFAGSESASAVERRAIGRETSAPLSPPTLSYAALLGSTAWLSLPSTTRARFEQHDACFVGAMTLRASACGRWVARLCRLIGSPLPPPVAGPVVATVRVERDAATGGSRWTRSYALPTRAVRIASVKAVGGDGRLVERLAAGLRMELDVSARDGELHFVSTRYYIEFPAWFRRRAHRARWRLYLPSWWLPGCTHVVHRDLGDGRFRFTMTIRHALLGELFNHDGVFRSIGES